MTKPNFSPGRHGTVGCRCVRACPLNSPETTPAASPVTLAIATLGAMVASIVVVLFGPVHVVRAARPELAFVDAKRIVGPA